MSDEPTLKDLRERAGELEIEGRSSMDREALEAAIAKAERNAQSGVTHRPTQRTDAQTSTAGLAASGDPAPEPGTEEEVGRPVLSSVAEDRAANRKPRVIGAANQED